jgi:hypothetical protein
VIRILGCYGIEYEEQYVLLRDGVYCRNLLTVWKSLEAGGIRLPAVSVNVYPTTRRHIPVHADLNIPSRQYSINILFNLLKPSGNFTYDQV